MSIRGVILRIEGRVQGVGFRAWARREAETLGVAGSVRNLADGSVEVVAEGEPARVAAMIDACRRGPRYAEVTAVTVTEHATSGMTTFDVVRGGWG